MKKITAFISAALALSLTACSGSDEKTPSGNSTNNFTNNSQGNNSNSEETSYNSTPLPFTLFGADNVQINFGDVSAILDKSKNPVSPDKLEDTGWNEITCEGFAYLSEHPSTLLNSVDHADRYNPETIEFADVPSYTDTEYKRYYVGDKLGSLTLKSAKTTFSREGFNDKSGPLTSEQIKAEGIPFAAMLKRCDASFEGSLTMTGYIRVNVDEYGVEDGDVLFAPGEDCPLPVINFYAERERDRIVTPLWTQETHDFAYVSEYPMIRLGNIYRNADVGDIPADGTSTKVTVTVTDISMFSDTAMSSFIDCKIVNIEKI